MSQSGQGFRCFLSRLNTGFNFKRTCRGIVFSQRMTGIECLFLYFGGIFYSFQILFPNRKPINLILQILLFPANALSKQKYVIITIANLISSHMLFFIFKTNKFNSSSSLVLTLGQFGSWPPIPYHFPIWKESGLLPPINSMGSIWERSL